MGSNRGVVAPVRLATVVIIDISCVVSLIIKPMQENQGQNAQEVALQSAYGTCIRLVYFGRTLGRS